MKKPKKPEPFDLKMDDQERIDLGNDFARDIQAALDARSDIIGAGGKIDLADWFYEQGQTLMQDRPFIGAADLTSYIVTENVDALRSRLVQAVFGVRPFSFVEGKGPDAKKAPGVEEFMDWQVRASTLPEDLAKTVHGALIEDCYILEVSEKIETSRKTVTVNAAVHTGPDGQPLFVDGKIKAQVDANNEPIEAAEGAPAVQLEYTSTKTKRLGPQYDPISMKDFVFLPGTAKSQKTVWGYAYRIYERVSDLREGVEDGRYDADAVSRCGDSSDREDSTTATPSSDVAPQYGDAREKELFQLSIKRDLDEDGREEWYIATVSLRNRELLRLKRDHFADKHGSRCVPFILCPRRNSVYGYSYAFDKLQTLAEEHTSLRNMKADRGALATNAPIMQVVNGLWDANAEPFGVGRVIHVRDQHELMQMQVSDVPVSIVEQERAILQAKERVGGLADSAVGVLSGERRTLGENKLVAGGSAVRVKEFTSYLHVAIARVLKLAHAIWVDTLEADPKGIEAPEHVAKAMAQRGTELEDGRLTFTVDMIRGDYQFEPYGSDETADPEKRKADFNTGLQALGGITKVFPMLGPVMQDADATQAVLEQWLRVFDVRDRDPFLNAFKKFKEQQAQAAAAAAANPMMGPPMGPGGSPSGAPTGLPPQLMALLGGGAPAGGGMPSGGAY